MNLNAMTDSLLLRAQAIILATSATYSGIRCDGDDRLTSIDHEARKKLARDAASFARMCREKLDEFHCIERDEFGNIEYCYSRDSIFIE